MTRQIEATSVWRIRQRKPQRGRGKEKRRGREGGDGGGRQAELGCCTTWCASAITRRETNTTRHLSRTAHWRWAKDGGQRETSCLAGFYFYLFSFFCCRCCCSALVLFAVKGSETRVRVNKRNARTTGSIFRVVCVYFYQALQRFNPNLWDLLAVIVVRVLLSLSLSLLLLLLFFMELYLKVSKNTKAEKQCQHTEREREVPTLGTHKEN